MALASSTAASDASSFSLSTRCADATCSAKALASGSRAHAVNGFYWRYLLPPTGSPRNASEVSRAFLNFTIPSGITNATAKHYADGAYPV